MFVFCCGVKLRYVNPCRDSYPADVLPSTSTGIPIVTTINVFVSIIIVITTATNFLIYYSTAPLKIFESKIIFWYKAHRKEGFSKMGERGRGSFS